MSYMRGAYYIYVRGNYDPECWCQQPAQSKDTKRTCYKHQYLWIEGRELPLEAFDALVAMRYLELVEEGLAETVERAAAEKYAGNFGSYALQRKLGRDPVKELTTFLDRVREARIVGATIDRLEADGVD